MPKESIISSKEKCTIIVSKKTHNALVEFAKLKGITVQEATYRMILIGFSVTVVGKNGKFLEGTEFLK